MSLFLSFRASGGRSPENLRLLRLQDEAKGPERLGGGSSELFLPVEKALSRQKQSFRFSADLVSPMVS
jgi:hypothetical protein